MLQLQNLIIGRLPLHTLANFAVSGVWNGKKR
jgi:hypothetical protein